MKIVFFGTPNYVVPVLEALHKALKNRGESPIAAVVTQEPKLSGREQQKTFSPVDAWAYQHKKPIYFNPMDIVTENIDAEIAVLASFGKIIPDEVIKYFKYGIINIHPSLLPQWRGASPIQATIVSGQKETGVTFMKLDPLLDHGEIISQFKDEVFDTDNNESLRTRLFERASNVLVDLIPAYTSGKIKTKPQEHDKATFTKQLKKEDGFIPPKYLEAELSGKTRRDKWEISWMKVDNKSYYSQPTVYNVFSFIRAMEPWPGAWTSVKVGNDTSQAKRLKILKAHLSNLQTTTNGPQLMLDEVQLEGKSPVSWRQFTEGYPNAKF